jgi:outer membrane protein
MRNFVVTNIVTTTIVVLGFTSTALAQTANSQKIGTINIQQAVQSTQEAKAAMAKLQREFVEPRTKNLEGMQNEIKDLQDKLQRSGNTLSQTAKDDQQAEINRKTKTFNRAVEDYQADSDDKQRELLADFSTKMQGVMDVFARDNGYALIFDTSNRDQSGLMWASAAVDVTGAIIAAYDKAHPSVAGATAPPITPTAPPPAQIKPVTPPPSSTKPPATSNQVPTGVKPSTPPPAPAK